MFFDDLKNFTSRALLRAHPEKSLEAYAYYDSAEGISPENGLKAQQRIHIRKLTESLSRIYAPVVKLLGAERFSTLVESFTRYYPLQSPYITHYGAELSDFSEKVHEIEKYPYLIDLMRVCWTVHRCQFLKSDTMMREASIKALLKRKDGNYYFNLSKSIELIDSEFPIYHLYRYATGKNAAFPDLTLGKEVVIIWKSGFEVSLDIIEPIEKTILEMIASKKTFLEIAEECAHLLKPTELISHLAVFMHRGFINGASDS